MKIGIVKLICPKCGREYENKVLMSYSSIFESAAKSFLENNKEIYECEVCKVELERKK